MPTVTLPTYLRITRTSALFDILVAAPFATPWTFALFYLQLSRLNMYLGGAALPPFAHIHILITCLMGNLVLLWSVRRLLEPSLALGRYDGAGRFLFATWMVWALVQGGLPVVWLFLVAELLWGVAQWWPVAPARAARRSNRPGLKLVRS
ncbi:hypothetical protein [Massilia sp. IC2-476]|uniref:hypothetical protein n=1 Tax=Massilia sp. IC2-476 TaxID=2887199 RepID=UPI001D1250AD|nr:hypothetical protein [Massilia sp. IC2-476]MCC2972901.1 hypothetical protein [Massilia sp. IC2-476]